jgi:hypothetical protein
MVDDADLIAERVMKMLSEAPEEDREWLGEWVKNYIRRYEYRNNPNFRAFAHAISDDIPDVIAWDVGIRDFPSVVWKYRDWSDAYHRKTITEQTVYFADARTLNDLFEFRQPFIDGVVNVNDAAEEYGVLSLSSECDNPLLWAHYGRQHAGFCVGFNSDFLTIDTAGILLPVEYDSAPMRLITPEEIIVLTQRILSRKAHYWKYENEIRMLRPGAASKPLRISKDTICSIVFGCRILESDKNEIIEHASNLGGVDLYDAVPRDDGSTISIIKIN